MKTANLSTVPGPARRGGYIYVVKLQGGIVKVGRTADARDRLASYGSARRDHWLSPAHVEWHRNEDDLIMLAHMLGGEPVRNTREYFRGVRFATLTNMAAALPFSASPQEATARQRPAWCLQGFMLPESPACVEISPRKTAVVAEMTACDLDAAREALEVKKGQAADRERAVFGRFYDQVRPLLAGGLTVADILGRLGCGKEQPTLGTEGAPA